MDDKLKKKLKRDIQNQLRQLHNRWAPKREARELAKVKVEVGLYKNGKPKYKNKYRCASCEQLFNKEETQMDHIESVINLTGFYDWNTYIDRMFVDVNLYQCLCKSCHNIKTQKDNTTRRKNLTKKGK